MVKMIPKLKQKIRIFIYCLYAAMPTAIIIMMVLRLMQLDLASNVAGLFLAFFSGSLIALSITKSWLEETEEENLDK